MAEDLKKERDDVVSGKEEVGELVQEDTPFVSPGHCRFSCASSLGEFLRYLAGVDLTPLILI